MQTNSGTFVACTTKQDFGLSGNFRLSSEFSVLRSLFNSYRSKSPWQLILMSIFMKDIVIDIGNDKPLSATGAEHNQPDT